MEGENCAVPQLGHDLLQLWEILLCLLLISVCVCAFGGCDEEWRGFCFAGSLSILGNSANLMVHTINQNGSDIDWLDHRDSVLAADRHTICEWLLPQLTMTNYWLEIRDFSCYMFCRSRSYWGREREREKGSTLGLRKAPSSSSVIIKTL